MTVVNPTYDKNIGSPPTLPDWIPPLDTGQPSAQDINDLSDIPRTNYAARNTPIPIPYGRDRYFGKPFVITICETTGCLMVAYAIGEGEIGGYESIIVDNKDILTNATGYYGLKNAGFQTGDSEGWGTAFESATVEANEGRSGTGDYALRIASLAGGPSVMSDRLPVPYDGATIKISGWARRDPASLPDANAYITVRTATTFGGTLTFQTVGNFTGDLTAESTTSGWQYLEGYWTLPAGVVEFVINVNESDGTTGHWFWDDIHFDFVNIDGSDFETRLMEFNLYRGESGQGVNGMLYNALTGFSDTYDGLAYIVGRFPPGSTSGFPRVEVIYQGRKVYDPRKDSTAGNVGDLFSVTRAQTAWFRDYEGVYRKAPPNEAQIDGCRRVENLCLYSNQFDDATWTKTRVTVPQSTTMLDSTGKAYAWKLTEDTSTNTHNLRQTFSNFVVGKQYLYKAEVKIGERPQIQLYNWGVAATEVRFDLSDGSIIQQNGSVDSAGSRDLGNGWYEVWFVTTAASASPVFAMELHNGTGTSYTGDGTSGVYVARTQAEMVDLQTHQIPGEYLETTSGTSFRTYNTDLFGKLLTGSRTVTNHLLYSEDFSNAAWTKAGPLGETSGYPDPNGGTAGWYVEDANAGGYRYIYQVITGPGLNYTSRHPWICSIYILKDDVPAATRYPLFRLAQQGGTGHNQDMVIDTSTGAYSVSDGLGDMSGGVEDAGDFWRAWFMVHDKLDNTSVQIEFYPAVGDTTLNHTYNVNAQGSCVIAFPMAEYRNPSQYGYKIDIAPHAYVQSVATKGSYTTTTDTNGVTLPGGRGLLCQETRTNEVSASNLFENNTTWWTGNTNFTITEVTGLFEGYSGWQHNNNGGGVYSRTQAQGVFTDGEQGVMGIIVENVDATAVQFGVRDQTASAFLSSITVTWSDLSVTQNAGSEPYWIEDLGIGPNGGQLIRASVQASGVTAGTGGNGNSRTLYIYPTGSTANTNTAIIHHIYFQEDHTGVETMPMIAPIVTDDATNVTVAETIITSNPANADDYFDPYNGTVYIAYDTSVHEGANNAIVAWGSAGLYEFEANQTAEITGGGNWLVSSVRPETLQNFVATWNVNNQQDAFSRGIDGIAEANVLPGTQPTDTDIGTRGGGLESNLWIQEIRYYNKDVGEATGRLMSRGQVYDNIPYHDDSLKLCINFARDMSTRVAGNLGGEGTHRANDSTTWEYSSNPALCFRDCITSFSGWDVWDDGVMDLADYNDQPIADNVKRRDIGLTIIKPGTVEKWTKLFRTYMGGFIGWEHGKVRVIPNRADVTATNAVQSDGVGASLVRMLDDPSLDVGTGDFCVEFWFNSLDTDAATKGLVYKKSGITDTSAGWSIFSTTSNDVRARIADGTNSVLVDGLTDVMDGNWHHCALSVDRTADEASLYIDFALDTATVVDISTVTGSLDNAIDLRVFESIIATVDELRIWNTTRTLAQLQANAYSEIENPQADTTLIGYWKFNEDTSETTAPDMSGNDNDGAIEGDATFTSGYPQVIPVNVAMHITADDIVKNSLKLTRRSLRKVPNSVAVDYRDASGTRWRNEREQTDSPRLSAGDELRRISRVSLPGIHNATQAKREATERLNWYLTDLEATVTLFDEGWELQHGSIVAVTHPIGLDAKLFRVTRTTGQKGRWTVDMVEYDPAVYSSEVVADPTLPDTNLGDPLNPPIVTGLNAVEELFNYKNGNTGSRLRITYDSVGYPFFSQYLLEGYVDGVKVWQTNTQSTEVVTPPVEELVTLTAVDYTVRVYVQSPFATGLPVDFEVAIQGKLAPPSDVPSISAIQTAADTVELNWQPATDIDIWRYEIRRGTTSDTWATATQIPQQLLIDGLSTTRTGIPVGTYRFFIKAIDSVGNESVNAKTVDVTLGVPQPATNLTGFEVASEVRLSWQAPATGFGERYRISYDTIPATNEQTLDIVDTLRFSTKDVPEGTWRFKVTTQDKNGVESATAPTIDIEVTSDADSFLADTYDFIQATTVSDPIRVATNGTLTNMHEFFLRTDDRLLYVTNMGDVFSSSPSDFNTYAAEALANYHSSGASLWLSETVDFGLLLTGSWNLSHDVETLNAPVSINLELSTDNVSFTSYGTAAKGEFRYARVRIATTTTATAFVKSPVMNLKINVVPLEESGNSTSATNQGKTINLTREYTAVKEINAQPRDKTDGLMAVVDNIIVGSKTAIEGDGVGGYLSGGDIAAFDFGATQDFTCEFWVKNTGNSGAMRLFGKYATGGWRCDIGSSDVISFLVSDGTNTVTCNTAATIPNDGEYHHVSVRVDRTGDVVNIKIDDTLDSNSPHSISTVTGALDAGAAAFTVFATSTPSFYFDGALTELRIWDDLRTDQELTDNKDVELDMTQTQLNLLAYWRFNGNVGNAVTTGAGDVQDATTNNYDLTATSGLTYVDPGDTVPIQKINSFDVYVFDVFGQQLLEAFQWNWKGV